jgi:hypothetical protein
MAVVINEFEVAPAPAPAPASGAPQASGAGSGQPDTARKIHKTLQLQLERKLRLAVY